MSDLSSKKCVPCEGGAPPLDKKQIESFLKDLSGSGWILAHEEGVDKIRKQFQFKDFNATMEFVNKIASIAEREGHHPDIHIWYSKVLLVLWTHAVKGLSENDFIMAAKIDRAAA
ncbi:MAG: 4a-hydroxytetrahydrobiopterin dehydratase [bacterium]|nr:4a-hydroxytetrahydrobiopterin dehydratase [bacterium]